MQDFHADCIINIQVQAQGHPGKLVWACSLTTRNSVRLLHARRFLGIVGREEGEWQALLFGLRQAQRLQQEKVQLACDFAPDFEATRKHRDPEIQLLKAEAAEIWKSFRLRKTSRAIAAEESFLRDEIAKVFTRKPKG